LGLFKSISDYLPYFEKINIFFIIIICVVISVVSVVASVVAAITKYTLPSYDHQKKTILELFPFFHPIFNILILFVLYFKNY
jgi:heme/copper-type cytochrome/quinol oxidase subunit 2